MSRARSFVLQTLDLIAELAATRQQLSPNSKPRSSGRTLAEPLDTTTPNFEEPEESHDRQTSEDNTLSVRFGLHHKMPTPLGAGQPRHLYAAEGPKSRKHQDEQADAGRRQDEKNSDHGAPLAGTVKRALEATASQLRLHQESLQARGTDLDRKAQLIAKATQRLQEVSRVTATLVERGLMVIHQTMEVLRMDDSLLLTVAARAYTSKLMS